MIEKLKILRFVCEKGKHRSPTGAEVFNIKLAEDGLGGEYHADFAGVNPESERRLTQNWVDEAHLLIPCDGKVELAIKRGYMTNGREIWRLNIEDSPENHRNSPQLVSIFNALYEEWRRFYG